VMIEIDRRFRTLRHESFLGKQSTHINGVS